MSSETAASGGLPRRLAVLCVIGVLAGAGAAVLQWAVRLSTGLFMTTIVGYTPPEPVSVGEHLTAIQVGLDVGRIWWLPAVTAAGMVIAVMLSRLTDHSVQGTDGVIAAVNASDSAHLTARGAVVKLLGTAATLGAGGSGGTEGPVAQVGASLAAQTARRFRLSEADQRTAVAAGLAAGVGALFRAPLGGAVLGAEIFRRRGAEWSLLLPGLLASLVAYGLYSSVLGFAPMFGRVSLGPLVRWADLLSLTVLGVVCAALVRLYTWTFHTVGLRLTPLKRWPLATAGIAGALVGAAGILVPELLGTGYGTIQDELSGAIVLAAPLWLLAALPLIKIIATSVTLGSGGVGGVFGPAMFIGAGAGALSWRLALDAGLHPGPAALYVATGIAACLGPAVRAPLAAIAVVTEATGFGLPPLGLLLAVTAAHVLSGGQTLFPSQAAPDESAPQVRLPAHTARLLHFLPHQAKVRYAHRMRYQNDAKAGPRPESGERGGRETGGSARGGSTVQTVDPEAADGIPDISRLPLDALTGREDGALEQAIRTALARRADSGIVYAGFNNKVLPSKPMIDCDESAR